MVRASGVGITLPKQGCPAIMCTFAGQGVDACLVARIEGKMIQARCCALMMPGTQIRRFLQDQVRCAPPPTYSMLPLLIRLVTECLQDPAPFDAGSLEIGNPEFDVVQRAC